MQKDFIQKIFGRFPSFSQCQAFFKILNPKERVFFILCFILFLGSSTYLLHSLYIQKTILTPANGGILKEGVLGQPRFINPALASNDVDRDITELTFAGLMEYDLSGKLVPGLAEEYTIDSTKTIYEITLKQEIYWSDGKPITADDIVFTVQILQDPSFKSSEIASWIGVEVEKITEQKVAFKLDEPYFPFLERLTIKIIPMHIFKDISPENFSLSNYNLQEVIGSGPFEVKSIENDEAGRINSLILEKNENYYGKAPYVEGVTFYFFENTEDLYEAADKGKIDAFVLSQPNQGKDAKISHFQEYMAIMPRYFAVFLNPEQNTLLEKAEIRQALSLSVDKEKILKEAVNEKGDIIYSPLLPNIYGFEPAPEQVLDFEKASGLLESAGLKNVGGQWIEPEQILIFESRLEKGDENKEVESLQICLAKFPDIYPEGETSGYFGPKTEKAVVLFQEKYKEEVLDPWGFDSGTGIVSETTRKKLNEICNPSPEKEGITFTLTTIDQPFLVKTAEILKESWEALGFNIEIKYYDFNALSREKIKPREYEMLLFGEMLGLIPDPFPFWHSSRTQSPGLNLSLYDSKSADEALEAARKAKELEKFQAELENFQTQVLDDQPAIFLFSPGFCYLANQSIHGIELEIIAEPSKRFENIEEWYIKVNRSFK